MYDANTLQSVLITDSFLADLTLVHSSLNALRYGRKTLFDQSAKGRLSHFVECVLASAPTWTQVDSSTLCRTAGEIAELLSTDDHLPAEHAAWLRLRAALLYELGEAPSIASTMLRDEDAPSHILEFFRRTGPFDKLNGYTESAELAPDEEFSIEWSAAAHDTTRVAAYLQMEGNDFSDLAGSAMSTLAKTISLPLLATDYQAIAAVVRMRLQAATRSKIYGKLLEALRTIAFPAELWTAQLEAIANEMLSEEMRSWVWPRQPGPGRVS